MARLRSALPARHGLAIRRVRTSKALAARSAELAFAAPQVIAHRMLGSDRKELHRMGAEKVLAFGESWNAMLMQSFLEYQRLAITMTMSFWTPWLAPRRSPFSSVMPAILGAGLAPIHRRARANVTRLRRRKPRRR